MLVRIAVAVVLVPLLLLAMLPSSPLIWSIVVAAIAAAASFELLRAAGEDKVSPWMTCVAVLSAALIPLGCWMGKGTTTVSVCTFVVMAVSFWCAIRAYDEGTAPIGFYHVMLTLFSGVLIPLGLSALVLLKMMDHGEYWVLFAVLMAFVTDAGAYFVGVFFGKHRGITRSAPTRVWRATSAVSSLACSMRWPMAASFRPSATIRSTSCPWCSRDWWALWPPSWATCPSPS